jgi:hypothetical protein
MAHIHSVVFAVFTALLTGCGSMPGTPELLIQNAKDGATFSDKDSIVVKRSFADVSDVLKKKSNECFQQKVAYTVPDISPGIKLNRREVRAFTPKVAVTKQRTRVTVQSKLTQGPAEMDDMPPDGWYMLVVDAYPVDKGTTRVESYFQQPNYQGVFTAIKQWANGTNMGCPDLTQ